MTARLLIALCLGLAAFAAQAHEAEMADAVLVDKGERQLHLMRGGEVWKSYSIGLGFAPEGHKQQA